MRNIEQLLLHIYQLLTLAPAVQRALQIWEEQLVTVMFEDLGQWSHMWSQWGHHPEQLGMNWILLWALIRIKIKTRLGRASSLSKHRLRRKESSVVWNDAPETETLCGEVLPLSLELIKCIYLKWRLEYFMYSLTMKWYSIMMLNSATLLNMPYFRWYKKSL